MLRMMTMGAPPVDFGEVARERRKLRWVIGIEMMGGGIKVLHWD